MTTGKRERRDVEGRTRRAVLAAATVLAGSAGCLSDPEATGEPPDDDRDASAANGERGGNDPSSDSSDREERSEPTEDEPTGNGGSWPAFGFDASNVGYGPETNGPRAGDIAWLFDAGTPTMNCSPIVADGTVYTAATGGDGGIFAIDAASGDLRWQFETDEWASSAPGFDGERLYVGTRGYRFHALDAETGEVRWTREFDHQFGTSSPAVVDGTVYVGTNGDAPMVVSGPEDEDQFEAPAIVALEAETGVERWRYDAFGERDSIRSSPAVADGLVFVTTPEGALLALETDSGVERWRRDLEAASDASPAVANGVVYCPGRAMDDARGGLWALEAATGDRRWRTEIDELSLRTSPAIADGVVYLAGSTMEGCPLGASDCEAISSGTLYAIDAATGDQRWTADLEPDTRSAPAVADGAVYVGSETTIAAIDVDGTPRFRIDLAAHADDESLYLDSSPAVADGRAYVGASDGRLYAIGEE